MDSECRAVGDLGNSLSSGFLPPTVKIILCNNAAFMLQ